MMSGSPSGLKRASSQQHLRLGSSLFLNEEGGYTSIAMVLALLLSLALLFSLANVQWINSHATDVQEIADAAALAGETMVGAYATIAQVLDACVLSMGLVGMTALGAALVISAIPGGSGIALNMEKSARSILTSRSNFLESSSAGLQKIEQLLPVLVAGNASTTIEANCTDSISYAGSALAFPLESQSHFPDSASLPNLDDITHAADELRKQSDKAADAKQEMDEALYEGWYYDCGKKPYSLYQRAQTLAGLSGAANPYYASPDSWSFTVPIKRARAYYAQRLAKEAPESSDIEAITDSCARKAFYSFADEELNRAFYREENSGAVSLLLPRLPKNTAEIRATKLYTQQIWPCSYEQGVRTLHSTSACPGATGSAAGYASLQDEETGVVGHCDVCRMDVGDMGKTPLASTAIENGFEYHWRKICEASETYQMASQEYARAQEEIEELTKTTAHAFDEALQTLSIQRPRLCPPGAWGCVAVVVRASGASTPTQLSSLFCQSAELPQGAALAGAVLAPDSQEEQGSLLTHFFDELLQDGHAGFITQLSQALLTIWSKFLQAYSAGYTRVSDTLDAVLSSADSILPTGLSNRFKEKLVDIMRDLGLEPADVRARKPVLVSSQTILNQAGVPAYADARAILDKLPANSDAQGYAEALGTYLMDELADQTLTIAELPIPGTELNIPLTIELGKLLGGAAS